MEPFLSLEQLHVLFVQSAALLAQVLHRAKLAAMAFNYSLQTPLPTQVCANVPPTRL